MGFDLTSVTHTGFNDGSYQSSDFDAFFVSTTAFNPLTSTARSRRRRPLGSVRRRRQARRSWSAARLPAPNVTLFGTEPLYRTHPEGLYEQVANALWWKGLGLRRGR
jgi:hypothetical protein